MPICLSDISGKTILDTLQLNSSDNPYYIIQAFYQIVLILIIVKCIIYKQNVLS